MYVHGTTTVAGCAKQEAASQHYLAERPVYSFMLNFPSYSYGPHPLIHVASTVVYSVRTTFVCCKTPHTLPLPLANSISQLNFYVYPSLN